MSRDLFAGLGGGDDSGEDVTVDPDARVAELEEDCPFAHISQWKIHAIAHSSFSTFLWILTSVWLVIRCKRRQNIRSIAVYFYIALLYDFLGIISRNVIQKMPLPIMGSKIAKSLVWTGWYKNLDPTTVKIFQEILNSSYMGNSFVLIFLNIEMFVRMKRSKFKYFPIVAIVVEAALIQLDSILRLHEVPLSSWLAGFMALLSALLVTILRCYNVEKSLEIALTADTTTYRSVSRSTSTLAILNAIRFFPYLSAWFVILTTYKLMQKVMYDKFSTNTYEAYLVIGITELSKYYEALKNIIFLVAIKPNPELAN